ncbi:DUF1214 domain-containing protein [Devosia sp. FKR38]|uniref:DUF1214 domain-containing protein n=1 Tax=Devosia sp. FKR38 TaxID=2562312 RepID=UPI0010C14D10|nr:DUF1214 domain-containing protein [Devosia sp. FKR38]
MRFVLYLLMMCTVALGVGFGLSYYALTDGRLFGAVEIGPWAAWPDAGSPTPNPYTRSFLVREGHLQLGQAEGIRFTATADSNGEPLTRDCSYVIAGMTPLATGWTLVAVDAQGVNIAASDADPVLRSSGLARPNDGAIAITIGKHLAAGNWLELSGDGPFSLVLSLYDTATFSGFSSDSSMPAITRESCP